MALRIEDYAMIGDTESGALVGKNGSIDWFCAPRFDSPALFAALLGTEANGHWQIAPVGQVRRVERRYRQDALVLETDFEMDGGVVRIVDCMPPREGHADIVRIVEGVRGSVEMQMRLAPRFDYGRLIPSLGRIEQGIFALAGPDALCLRTQVDLRVDSATASAMFTVSAGERLAMHLVWYPSHLPRPELFPPANAWRCTSSGIPPICPARSRSIPSNGWSIPRPGGGNGPVGVGTRACTGTTWFGRSSP
jgi:GH15 family glucan-1,4-alpha-glucosidase